LPAIATIQDCTRLGEDKVAVVGRKRTGRIATLTQEGKVEEKKCCARGEQALRWNVLRVDRVLVGLKNGGKEGTRSPDHRRKKEKTVDLIEVLVDEPSGIGLEGAMGFRCSRKTWKGSGEEATFHEPKPTVSTSDFSMLSGNHVRGVFNREERLRTAHAHQGRNRCGDGFKKGKVGGRRSLRNTSGELNASSVKKRGRIWGRMDIRGRCATILATAGQAQRPRPVEACC